MLPRIRIIQVGDVHLPTTSAVRRSVDAKDDRFPVDLRNVIAVPPTKRVFKAIYSLIEKGEASAILFMGDLTDIGGLAGYQACARYIRNSLQIGPGDKYEGLETGIVPGNHDIDREVAKQPGLSNKFDTLQLALKAAGLPPLPVAKPIWRNIKSGSAAAKIGLLNSCWGCGSKEYIPIEFRETVFSAIDQAINAGSKEKVVRAYYDRQFDTPAFSDDTITELANVPIDGDLLIVVAHHNILPQRMPRLAPYTELVNSGAVRSTLCELARPILYLHGHIHEDPVEIIQIPGGEPLVCISAPAASDGFNVLEITYSRVGVPVGVRVMPWRFNASGILRLGRAIPVSLIGTRRLAHNRTLPELYSVLLKFGKLYWAEILKEAEKVFTDDVEGQLEEAIEILLADGKVSIDNYDLPKTSWIIGATV